MSAPAKPLPSLSELTASRRGAAVESDAPCKIEAEHLNFFYGEKRALEDISIKIKPLLVTAFIGPSGCGKSTFLRTLNRMNDIIPATRVEGRSSSMAPISTRRRWTSCICAGGSGWSSRSRTRFRNRSSRTSPTGCASTAWRQKSELAGRVEESLKQAALWEEVKDRLHESALALSGGQQQRLCIARALAIARRSC
jgi:phosphate transport system ATP-binding protein